MKRLKHHPEEFALMGGRPTFSAPLHSNSPRMGNLDTFKAHVDGIWERNWLTNSGPLSEEFEQALAAHLGVSECVLAVNGTTAMMMLIKAMGLSGNIILPSFTFVSTPHALVWSGIEARFCDVTAGQSNICPEHCRSLIDHETSAIIATHCWGHACDVSALKAIAEQHNIALIFDAAHAFDCTYKGQKIGRFGHAEVFSLHATKFFNSVEGGAITTDDKSLAYTLRQMRNFGFSGYDETDSIGFNGKMSELHAAAGLTNLECIDQSTAHCHQIFDIYQSQLDGVPGVTMLAPPTGEVINKQYVVALIDQDTLGLSRDVCIDLLHAEGVLARRYFYPGCHKLHPHSANNLDTSLPNSEDISARVIVLPGGANMNADDARSVCELMKSIAGHAQWLADKLRSAPRNHMDAGA